MPQLTSMKKLARRVGLKGIYEADRALHRFGYEIKMRPETSWFLWQERVSGAARQRLLANHEIDLVVDVGANTGQYGHSMREIGYNGPVVSFEPQRQCIPGLSEAARVDGNWTVVPVAIGAADGELLLNVAGNSVSSSLLPMLDSHVNAAPGSGYVAKELIPVRTTDGELSVSPYDKASNIWLKIDTQGYEWPVIEGAVKTLERTAVLEIELSLCPLYDGQLLLPEIVDRLERRGFALHALNEVFVDPATDRLLQVDGIFVKWSDSIVG